MKVGDNLYCIKEVIFNVEGNIPIYEVGGMYEIYYYSLGYVYILGKGSNKNNILRRGSGFWFNIDYSMPKMTFASDKYWIGEYFISMRECRKRKLLKIVDSCL